MRNVLERMQRKDSDSFTFFVKQYFNFKFLELEDISETLTEFRNANQLFRDSIQKYARSRSAASEAGVGAEPPRTWPTSLAYYRKTLIYLFEQLKCKMRLQIVRN